MVEFGCPNQAAYETASSEYFEICSIGRSNDFNLSRGSETLILAFSWDTQEFTCHFLPYLPVTYGQVTAGENECLTSEIISFDVLIESCSH